ncbi:MAG: hypothetical protein EB165_04385 [Euryarchaeota archaeon]|nr:hypothetical protein [Euryarchaeota archaeon]
MTNVNKMLESIGIWTPGSAFRGERHERLAHVFWDTVMGWDKPPVNRAEARTRQARIRNFLAECEYDDQLDRLIFKKWYYRKNKEKVFRFYTEVQARLSTYRKNNINKYYWVVVDSFGGKGFFWGEEVPKGNHIIFGKVKKGKSNNTPQSTPTPQPPTPQPEDEDEVPC